MSCIITDMDQRPFIVDFTDPADMASKLTEAERILDETNQKLAEVVPLQRKAQEWQMNVEFLRSKIQSAPPAAASPNGTEAATRTAPNGERPEVQTHVVGVVNRELRKIKSSLVRDILADEGYDFSPEQVSNALHHAATGPKLIQKWPERGMYAPLGYREAPPPPPAQEPPAWPASPVTLTAGGVLTGR
jgi:hypothetical protein